MGCVQCIPTSEVAIITFNGKFNRSAQAGCHFIMCPFEDVAGRVSLRVQQLNVQCTTKTKDNVTVVAAIAVQFQVISDKVYDAFYRLTDPTSQIRAFVEDAVRSQLPKMELDQVYEEKAAVAHNVQHTLSASMEEFGYLIHQALVTDIVPDINVRNAMNEINAAKRMRHAAQEKAEADKIMLVKAAEADAESKYLSGVGIARQRAAIVGGLRDSVLEFSDNVLGSGPKDVINILMITQYFDMLKDVGNNPTTSSVFIPNDSHTTAGGVRNGLLQGQAARIAK